MRLTINLSGFLEEVPELEAIPYLLKMYMKEVLELDIHIDPKDPHSTEFESESALIKHEYNLSENDFSITIDYQPKV